jgi:hypothetical protein
MRTIIVLMLGLLLTACDEEVAGVSNRGNVSITGNEGLLVGDGIMTVGAHTIKVGHGRIKLDGNDYGVAPEAAEIVLRVNGEFVEVLVNGETRGQVR